MGKITLNRKIVNGLKKTRESWESLAKNIFSTSTSSDTIWTELEDALLLGDVGLETTTMLVDRVKNKILQKQQLNSLTLVQALKEEVASILSSYEDSDRFAINNQDLAVPQIILLVGTNGSGKTTTLAKLAKYFIDKKLTVLFGAADTFRAAATPQLKVWADRLGVDVITGGENADPASVAFSTVESARARGTDITLIDTAGRLHANKNLMEELKKIRRAIDKVSGDAHQEVFLTLDATTGQNGIAQAEVFSSAVGCTGIILTKLDGSSKGGVILPIFTRLRQPVMFVGTGEKIDDLTGFDPISFAEGLFDNELLSDQVGT